MQSINLDLILGIISIIGSISVVFFYFGKLEEKINKNTYDINNSRSVIERDVSKNFDDILERYASSIKNLQIRLYNLEQWTESRGYNRIITGEDFKD